MKYVYQTFAILVFFFAGNSVTKAAHIIGGEMTYRCIGPDDTNPGSQVYIFTMKVYRDCQGGGAGFDSSPQSNTNGTVSVFQGNNQFEYLSVLLDAPVVSDISNETGNPCLIIPPNICGEQGVYTFILSLPVISESYHIVYQRCCRNSTITNIQNPSDAGATYTIELTEAAQQVCNSTPTFTNLPEAILCVNQELSIDNSAVDMDGDQLVYSFCSPLLGGSTFMVAPNPDMPPPFTNVQFILPNYSALNPMGGNPQVDINTFSGLVTGVPTAQGQFVVGICVQEFRAGVLLSTIQRDYQFNVAFCEPTVVAGLDGVDIGGTYLYHSCVDSTITLINESTDEAFINEYKWIFDINGNQPLSFNTRDITVTFPGPGFYPGLMILNPGTECSDTAVVEVTIAPPISPQFIFDYDTCIAGPVDFQDLTYLTNSAIDTWSWFFGDGNTASGPNPSHMYEDPGVIPVTLTVTDTIGCTETVTELITWFPVPPLIIIEPSNFTGCPPAEIEFINLSTPIDETYDIRWDFGDGGFDSIISPTHVFETVGLFDVSIEITSPIGCYTSQQFLELIHIDSLPIANFSFSPDKSSNFEPEVVFTDESIRAVQWDWTFDQYGSTIAQNPVFVFPDTGLMEVQLVVTHIYGCLDTMIQYVDVEPKITYFLPNAFTPNEDGINEFFRGGGFFRGIRDFNIKIMNRWGGIVFESTDPSEGWNGMKNNSGRLSQNGVYLVYV
ncbi:MAG: gliding motility-associated-like protein, partial [Saprospiraceae bacterium]